ncbi:MAG: glycosyltransferase family 39 protein [Pseudomonadota bacterium]
MNSTPDLAPARANLVVGVVLLALLVARVVGVLATNAELYADEAQYWRWSRSLEWGYYSKPPMIAWVIATSTAIFGNAEWAIRIFAPLLHTIAAVALYLLGREMFNPRVGMFAAIGYALMPGVVVSASIISTDGVLLPFWCTALYLFWRLRSRSLGWLGAVALGLCMGAGFLSKYAMLYFFIGLGLTTALDRDTRTAVLSTKGLTAIAIAAALIAPHIIWNASNDFATVSHTVDNANLEGELLNPENLVKFLLDQMGVFGPISFLALLGGIWAFIARPASGERDRRDLWLLAFILPVIVIIAGQSVLSRAHANWAATAYPAASVLVAAWLTRASPRPWLWIGLAAIIGPAFLLAPDAALLTRLGLGIAFASSILLVGLASKWRPSGLLWTSIGLHGLIAVIFASLFAAPPALSTTLGLDNALKRVRGWEDTAAEIAERAKAEGATAILVDEREVWHGLDYYMRDLNAPPLIAWRRNPGPKSFSEAVPLDDTLDDRVLVASYRPNLRPRMRADFEYFSHLGDIAVPLGRRSNGCAIERRFALYLASEYDELTRDQAWEDRFEGLSERPNPRCPSD